jgi:hypothetical protein
LAALGIVASFWGTLLHRVPRHFGITGNPDAYGSKDNVLAPALLAGRAPPALPLAQWIARRRHNDALRVSAETQSRNIAWPLPISPPSRPE